MECTRLLYRICAEKASAPRGGRNFRPANAARGKYYLRREDQGTRPWEPDDERHPLNVYGQTKYEGELAVEKWVKKFYIVRIAWVFGVNGKNFIKTMLNLGKTHDHLTVVDDQVGSPTYTYDLSRLLVDMAEKENYGRYHATNEGLCSWFTSGTTSGTSGSSANRPLRSIRLTEK